MKAIYVTLKDNPALSMLLIILVIYLGWFVDLFGSRT